MLPELSHDYQLVAANGGVAPYRTLYFDTTDLRCFHDHRRGLRPRYKVRVRHYPARELSYLEVKCKVGEQRTIKHRLERACGDNTLHDDDLKFIAQHTDLIPESLAEQVWTNFHRVTLVGQQTDERITIDTELTLVDHEHGAVHCSAVIMEVKQAQFSETSPAMRSLQRAGLCSVSASKYCAANILLHRPLSLLTIENIEQLFGAQFIGKGATLHTERTES